MSIAILLMAGLLTVLLGRFLFGNWFNHVSLYGFIWSISLSLFQARFISYYPLAPETWMLIGAAWVAFVLGSTTVVAFQRIVGADHNKEDGARFQADRESSVLQNRFLLRLLWVLNGVTILVALQHWFVVLKFFGSVLNVFVWGNLLYQARVHEEIPGLIPYLDSLGLSASLFAGAYVASQRRLKLVAILPLLIVVAEGIAAAGRSRILCAGILFASGFFLWRHRVFKRPLRTRFGWTRAVLGIVFLVALLVVGAEVIRSNRGVNENFQGMTSSLRKLRGASIITPTIYLYLTVHHGVFNQYLKRGKEDGPWGQYTLAPMWRFLSKLGFDTYIPQYQPFYRTPVGANTGSYLRELHSDFGPAGVIFGPCVLGAVASVLWFRWNKSRRLIDLILIGHLYVIICISFLLLATMWGYWLMSLIGGLILAALGDRQLSRAQ